MKKSSILILIFFISFAITLHAQQVFQKFVTLPNLTWFNELLYREYETKITLDKGMLIVRHNYFDSIQKSGIVVCKLDSNLNVQWTRNISTLEGGNWSGSDDIRDILLTRDSGFVLAGQYYISSGLGDESDSYIKKINAKGELVWEKSFYWKWYNACKSLAEDLEGNVIAVGNTDNDYNDYGWAAKIDISGNILWSHIYDHTYDFPQYRSVTATSDGGFAVLGAAIKNAHLLSYIIVKANKNGEIQRSFSLSNNGGFSKIKQLSDNSYILYGPGSIAKMDTGFVPVWSKNIIRSNYITAESIISDSNNNLIIAGSEPVIIEGHYFAKTQLINVDVINGELISAKQVGLDTVLEEKDIAAVPDGYLIVEDTYSDAGIYNQSPFRYKISKVNKALFGCELTNVTDTLIDISVTTSKEKVTIIDTLKIHPVVVVYNRDSTNYSIIETKCSDIILPLNLINFNVKKVDTYNTLYWTTSGEQDIAAFEIQRSSNARNFATIGALQADKNSLLQKNYTYQDKNPLQSNNHYRLKIIDGDGTYSYSNIKIIPGNNNFYVNIYPNPVNNEMKLMINSGKETLVQLRIMDMQGRILINNKVNIAEGESMQTINTSLLSKGIYIVQIISQDSRQQLKIVK